MSDNKQNTGKQDDIRVDANDPNEISYLMRQFPGKSREEIVDAVKYQGPMRDDIIRFLDRKS